MREVRSDAQRTYTDPVVIADSSYVLLRQEDVAEWLRSLDYIVGSCDISSALAGWQALRKTIPSDTSDSKDHTNIRILRSGSKTHHTRVGSFVYVVFWARDTRFV